MCEDNSFMNIVSYGIYTFGANPDEILTVLDLCLTVKLSIVAYEEKLNVLNPLLSLYTNPIRDLQRVCEFFSMMASTKGGDWKKAKQVAFSKKRLVQRRFIDYCKTGMFEQPLDRKTYQLLICACNLHVQHLPESTQFPDVSPMHLSEFMLYASCHLSPNDMMDFVDLDHLSINASGNSKDDFVAPAENGAKQLLQDAVGSPQRDFDRCDTEFLEGGPSLECHRWFPREPGVFEIGCLQFRGVLLS